MFKRLRTSWLAGSGAMILALSLTGVVAGFTLLADTLPPDTVVEAEPLPDTELTFEDTDGNGVDDDCQADGTVVADADAESAAQTAVDLDGDTVISVSEAARSGRIGGKNCNQGGYVSEVAKDKGAHDAAKAAAKAEHDAAKAAAKAERDAAKAERKAERDAAKAERKAAHDAAKAARHHGKPGG